MIQQRYIFYMDNNKKKEIDPKLGLSHGYTVSTIKSTSRDWKKSLWLDFEPSRQFS